MESWFKPNYHAHIVFDWMNHNTGKSRKLNDNDMIEMQSLASTSSLWNEENPKPLQARNIWGERFHHKETESRTATYR